MRATKYAKALSKPAGPRPDIRINGVVLLVDGKAVVLSPTEVSIMEALLAHWGQCLHHERLFALVYGNAVDGGPVSGTIAVFVTRLRRRFREHDVNLAILTHWGVGYELRRRDQ